MAKSNRSSLMKTFRKSFNRGDSDIEEGMEDEEVKPMTLYQSKKDRRVSLNRDFDDRTEPHSQIYGSDGESTDEDRLYGENDESNDEGYDSVSPEDDDEYERDQRKEITQGAQPSSIPKMPKDQRKRMSIAVLTKKMTKPKKASYT